jgi:hypothetical protein
MKTVRPYLAVAVILVAATFLVLAAGAPLAAQAPTAPPQAKPRLIKLPPKALSPCPAGWHVKPGTLEYQGKGFVCVPNTTPAIKCAPKFEYWKSPDGCAFGCRPIVY